MPLSTKPLDQLLNIFYAPEDDESPGADIEEDDEALDDEEADQSEEELEPSEDDPDSEDDPADDSDPDQQASPIGEEEVVKVLDPTSGEEVEVTGKELVNFLNLRTKQGEMATELDNAKKETETYRTNAENYDTNNQNWARDPMEYTNNLVAQLRQNGHDVRLVISDGEGDYNDYTPQQTNVPFHVQNKLETVESENQTLKQAELARTEGEKFDGQYTTAKETFGKVLTEGHHTVMVNDWKSSDDPNWDYATRYEAIFGAAPKKIPPKVNGKGKGSTPRKPQPSDNEIDPRDRAGKARVKLKLKT